MNLNRFYQQEMQEGGEPAASTEQPASEPLLDSSEPATEDGGWFLMDGVKGTGEPPEYFKASKYKSLSEQAKAYVEAEKMLGSFTGKPKDGYQLPEGLEGDDELVKTVMDWGEKNNLNQDGFNDLMNIALANAQATEEVKAENELKRLGENASQRIKQVEVFLKEKLRDSYDEVRDLVTSADDVILVEKIMGAIAPPKPVIEGGEHPQGITKEQVFAMLNEKDEYGNLKMSTDPAHKQKYERLLREISGEKDPYAVRPA